MIVAAPGIEGALLRLLLGALTALIGGDEVSKVTTWCIARHKVLKVSGLSLCGTIPSIRMMVYGT